MYVTQTWKVQGPKVQIQTEIFFQATSGFKQLSIKYSIGWLKWKFCSDLYFLNLNFPLWCYLRKMSLCGLELYLLASCNVLSLFHEAWMDCKPLSIAVDCWLPLVLVNSTLPVFQLPTPPSLPASSTGSALVSSLSSSPRYGSPGLDGYLQWGVSLLANMTWLLHRFLCWWIVQMGRQARQSVSCVCVYLSLADCVPHRGLGHLGLHREQSWGENLGIPWDWCCQGSWGDWELTHPRGPAALGSSTAFTGEEPQYWMKSASWECWVTF